MACTPPAVPTTNSGVIPQSLLSKGDTFSRLIQREIEEDLKTPARITLRKSHWKFCTQCT